MGKWTAGGGWVFYRSAVSEVSLCNFTNVSLHVSPQTLSFKMVDNPAEPTKDLAQVVSGSSEIVEQVQPRTRRKSKYGGPNEEFMQALMNLGISRNAAEKVTCMHVHVSCLPPG